MVPELLSFHYLLIDFQTVHYIVDGNGQQYLSDIITGTIEPLIITATSPTQIHAEAKSTPKTGCGSVPQSKDKYVFARLTPNLNN